MHRSDMVSETRQIATALGHRLDGFRFHVDDTGASACGICHASVLVIFPETRAVGAAVTLPCQDGEGRVPLPAVPTPPTGAGKRLPRMPATRPVPRPAPAVSDLIPLHVPPPRRPVLA